MSPRRPASRIAVTDERRRDMFARNDSGEVTPDGPIVEARGVTKTYDTGSVRVDALRGVDLTIRRGEMVSSHGPERLRQDDPAQLPLRPRRHRRRRGPDRGRRAVGDVRPRAHRLPRAPDGLRVPVLQPDAGPDGGRERRAAAAGGPRRRRRGAPARARGARAGRAAGPRAVTSPTSSPAASASA